MKKNIIILVVILLAVVGLIVLNKTMSPKTETIPQVVVDALNQTASTSAYEISVDVKATGVKEIDVMNALKAELAVADIVQAATEQESATGTSALLPYVLNMQSTQYTAPLYGLESQVVADYRFTGGAHGNTTYTTWTFLPASGETLDIDQIIKETSEAATFVFGKVQETVNATDTNMTDEEWLREGSGTNWDNYTKFYVSNEGLTFMFEQYQIAAYAAGTIEVFISWADLKPFLRGGFKSILYPEEVEEKEDDSQTSPVKVKLVPNSSNTVIKATATSTQ